MKRMFEDRFGWDLGLESIKGGLTFESLLELGILTSEIMEGTSDERETRNKLVPKAHSTKE